MVALISVCALALSSLPVRVSGGLLGAGTGPGSCSAPPFRADSTAWPGGCPAYAQVRPQGVEVTLSLHVYLLYIILYIYIM